MEGPRLDGSLTEQRFAAFVDKRRHKSRESAMDLLPLLSVSHEVFRGRSAGSATRMRAYAMAAFHDAGLPDDALPYIVEVLETSFRPNLVAAAARATKGAAAPDARLADYLVRAIYNIWQNDQPVSFEGVRRKMAARELLHGTIGDIGRNCLVGSERPSHHSGDGDVAYCLSGAVKPDSPCRDCALHRNPAIVCRCPATRVLWLSTADRPGHSDYRKPFGHCRD